MDQSGGGVNQFYNINVSGIGTKRKKIKDLFTEINITSLRNKVIAVDASNVLYEVLSAAHKVKKPGLYEIILRKKLNMWKANQLDCIWVFDNPKPNQLRLDICKSSSGVELTASNIRRAQEILREEKVKFITSRPGFEAEQVCAKLTRTSLKVGGEYLPKADYVMTCDSDALVFGAQGVLVRTDKSRTFKCLMLSDLLKELDINRRQLAIIAVILGTDFNEGIRGIGPATVVRMVKAKRYHLGSRDKKIVAYYLKD